MGNKRKMFGCRSSRKVTRALSLARQIKREKRKNPDTSENENQQLSDANTEGSALDMFVETEPGPLAGPSQQDGAQGSQIDKPQKRKVRKVKPKNSSELVQRMSERISLTPAPKYREMQVTKKPKLDSTAPAPAPAVAPASPAPPAVPRVAVRSLRELSSRLNTFMSRPEDGYDAFGRYIAGLLRRLPEHKALELQPRIVDMITSVLEEAPADEEPVIEEPRNGIPEAEQPEAADPLARPETEDVKPDIETIVFHVLPM